MKSVLCRFCGAVQLLPPAGADRLYRCKECYSVLTLDLAPEAGSPDPATPTLDLDAEAVPDGLSFGKYTLHQKLGSGGMGVVYDALDTTLNRRVALKVLFARKTDDPREAMSGWQRFIQEARACANLAKHPNIVTVYEAAVQGGKRYIAMERIQGLPLSEWRRKNPGPRPELVRMLRDVALAVHHAHEHGIVHRDIKPRNVLVDAAGKPIVTDFGLAQSLGSRPQETKDTTEGSPAYMSPEQALGLESVDRTTDVYSLGVMLYEVLSGRQPFEGGSPEEILSKVVHDTVPPPSEAVGDPDPALDEICLKAMAKEPQDRHPTSEAFAQELTRWLGDSPSKSHATPAPRSWSAFPLAAAAAFLAGVGTLLAWQFRGPDAGRADAARGGTFPERAAIEQRLREAEARAAAPVTIPLEVFKPVKMDYYRLYDYMHFGSAGVAEAAVTLPETGDYEVVVTAGGPEVAGEFPRFRILVDGRAVGEASLTAGGRAEYRVPARIGVGAHRLGVEFTNDLFEKEKGLDRNLYVYGVVLKRVR